MAIDTTNALHTVVSRYVEGIRRVDESYMQTFEHYDTDDAALRIAALTGIGALPSWNGTDDLDTTAFDSAGASTFTYSNNGVQVRLPRRLTQDIPELPGQAAVKLGTATAATMKALATAVYNGSFTTVKTADGEALCSASHTTSSGTRSNLLTSALGHVG